MHDPMQRAPLRKRGAPKSKADGPDSTESSAQLDIFAAIGDARAEARAQDGQTRALHGEDVRITAAAETAIREYSRRGVDFTADDILPGTANRRAIGALFSRLAREGVITCTGATVSRSPSRNSGLTRVWRGTGVS